eukprot:TRINITY_DN23237_c0_g1_i1.p1 TRINITY_DN23237_c0_g1~~TRINITY_DN23237_c0_g1_i1.p1  ORF type:complete len:449 (+),score=68.29 TRINITY_DN23237_c0_g1_i1:200-1348(+)
MHERQPSPELPRALAGAEEESSPTEPQLLQATPTNMLSLFSLGGARSVASSAAADESLQSLVAGSPVPSLSRKSSAESYNMDGSSPVVRAVRKSRQSSITPSETDRPEPTAMLSELHIDPGCAPARSPTRTRANTTIGGALGLKTSSTSPTRTVPPKPPRGSRCVSSSPLVMGLERSPAPPAALTLDAAPPPNPLCDASFMQRTESTGSDGKVAKKKRRRRSSTMTESPSKSPTKEDADASSSLLQQFPSAKAEVESPVRDRTPTGTPATEAPWTGSVMDTFNRHDKKFRERLTQKGLLQGVWENPRGRQVRIVGKEVTFMKNGRKDTLEELSGGRIALQGLTLNQASRDGKVVVWSDGERWMLVETENHGTYTPVELPLGR